MTVIVVRGNANRLPLPDNSVDLICTSPPYFALRSYQDNGVHYASQIGSEATPTAYIAALVECTREWVRVLKPSGSIFVNLGDKYGRPGGGADVSPRSLAGVGASATQRPRSVGGRDKSLMLLPERYRIACVDELGLIARAVLVWSKPNGLPESVTDRVRRSHEDWVHLVKQPRYFSAVDEIREPHTMRPQRRPGGRPDDLTPRNGQPRQSWSTAVRDEVGVDGHPLGKLPGSVWEVATEPLRKVPGVDVDHFAAFPSEWPRRLILGWSPNGVCTACNMGLPSGRSDETTAAGHNGLARRLQAPAGLRGLRDDGGSSGLRSPRQGDEALPDFAASGLASGAVAAGDCEVRREMRGLPHPEALGGRREGTAERSEEAAMRVRGSLGGAGDVPEALHAMAETRRSDRGVPGVGAAFCRCPAGTPVRPSAVVDPFGGTGTTAHVAAALGRTGVTVDLSADYCRLAAAPELADVRLRKVLGLDKAEPVLAGQLELDGVAG